MRSKHCVIVGGGPAGLAAALELIRLNFSVTLFEQASFLGGKVAEYCCKAAGTCNHCGACHVARQIEQVQADARIRVFLDTRITRIEPGPEGFTVYYTGKSGDNTQIFSGYVVWAAGFDHFNAAEKIAYGYGIYPNVFTGKDLDKMLLTADASGMISSPLRKIAFIHCVGSRDLRFGCGYCSQVCCLYSLRLANRLAWQRPDLEITMFYIDIQSPDREFAGMLAQLPKSIRLIRGLPGEVLSGKDHELVLRYERDNMDEMHEETFDMVVLATGIRPLKDCGPILQQTGVRLNAHGFLYPSSCPPGLTVAGTAAEPMTIMQSIDHSIMAVQEMAGDHVRD